MADFDWSMPLFEFFDSPTWQEISNDREIFLTSFYRKFSGHKHLKSLSSRRSRVRIGNYSKIPSFWNSSKLHVFMENGSFSRMNILEKNVIFLDTWFTWPALTSHCTFCDFKTIESDPKCPSHVRFLFS